MFNNQVFSAQYFPPQYHTLLGGTQVQNGRSGYWRLFFHQLQEAELEKNKGQGKSSVKPIKLDPVKELPDGSAIVGPEAKDKKRVKEKTVSVTEPKPNFTLRYPTLTLTLTNNTQNAPQGTEIAQIQAQLTALFTNYTVQAIVTQPRDVEDEELILLLAA